MTEKRFWRCTVCNDIHYGTGGPGLCPTCDTKNAYIGVDKEEVKEIMGL
jgi:rubrerythrin